MSTFQEPIIVYSADGCKFCDEAKELLATQGFSYEERNVNRSIEYLRQARELGNRWLPIITLGDIVLVSPSNDDLLNMLKKANGRGD